MMVLIRDMLLSPEAQPDAYTWGAALLGHFAVGIVLTAIVAGVCRALVWSLSKIGAARAAQLLSGIGAWRGAAIVAIAYLLLWEGAQLAFFGGGLVDGLVDATAVACGAVLAAGAWRNKGGAVAAALALLAAIGIHGIRRRR